MKCPKCGKEIANNSFFCEYCGTQIKPVKKVRKAPWVVMTIVFGVLTLGLCGLAYFEIKAAKIAQSEAQENQALIYQLQQNQRESNRAQRDADSKIYAAEQAKNAAETRAANAETRAANAERAKQDLEEKLRVWNNYTSQIPIVITDIQIGNTDYNGNIQTNYGSTIYSSSTMYLKPKIKYYGMTAGTKTIKVKMYKPDGTLSTGTNSPSGFSYKDELYFYTGHNEKIITGWGGTDKGHWKAGKYRFEFWYNNTCLGQKTFTIY